MLYGNFVEQLEQTTAESDNPSAEVALATPSGENEAASAEGATAFDPEEFGSAGPFDVVLDTLGGEAHVRSLKALKTNGVLVALSATPIPAHAPRIDVRVERPMIQASRERLAEIFDWVVKGRLRPQLTRRFHLEAANDAYAAAEAPHGRGKIVVEIS